MCLGILALLAIVNMRGVRETGIAFRRANVSLLRRLAS